MSDHSLLSYIDIEDAFTALILPGWEKEASKIAKKAALALERGHEDDALAAIDDLSMEGIIRRAKGPARHLAMSALLYGAKNASGSAKNTVFADEVPDALGNALTAFFAMVGPVLEKHVRYDALLEINEIVHELKDPAYAQTEQVVSLGKAEMSFIDRLNAAVNSGGRMMSAIGANLTTSRLVSYGFLAEATKHEITHYRLQATLDKRTSHVCRALDGREFRVDQAYSFMRQVLQITDPEELKTAAPWLNANRATAEEMAKMPSEDLQGKYGILVPPFHPNCRTILVKGDVTTTLTVSQHTFPSAVTPEPPEEAPTKGAQAGGPTTVMTEDALLAGAKDLPSWVNGWTTQELATTLFLKETAGTISSDESLWLEQYRKMTGALKA